MDVKTAAAMLDLLNTSQLEINVFCDQVRNQILLGLGSQPGAAKYFWDLFEQVDAKPKHYRFHSLDRSLQDRASGGHLGQGQNENSRNIRNRTKRCFR